MVICGPYLRISAQHLHETERHQQDESPTEETSMTTVMVLVTEISWATSLKLFN
jgi:hypothetical protein